MAFRGRGRGRGYGGSGGGGGGFRNAKQEPFEPFPEIKDFPDIKCVKVEMALFKWSSKLQHFWESSPYYYEGVGEATTKKESTDIEGFSNKDSGRTKPKPPLSDFIRMTYEHVPAELCGKKERHGHKKVRWNLESDLLKSDILEKLVEKYEGQDEKGEKEKKEGEDEEEDDEKIEEEEDFSDDGDYNQNIDFDDDEDDFNMGDDNDDEAIF